MRPPARVLWPVTAAALLLALVVSPAKAAPQYTFEERAEAIARPALMFIEAEAKGFVRDKSTGVLLSSGEFVVYGRCSGFVVNSSGYVMTSSQCVAPSASSWRALAFTAFADREITAGRLTEDGRANLTADLANRAEFTGIQSKSPPQVQLTFQHNAVRGSVTNLLATLIDVKVPGEDSVALIKADVKVNLPVVELSDTPATLDDEVLIIGYASLGWLDNDRTYVPRSRLARVARTPASETDVYKLDTDLGLYSQGGMAVDRSGRVIGLINPDKAVKELPRRAAIASSVMKAVLAAAGVTNALGDLDRNYRAGLDAYYGGRYAEARDKFDLVLASSRGHQLAAQYRRQAADRLAIEGESHAGLGFGWSYWAGVASAVVVVAVAMLVVFLVRPPRRRRVAPAAPEVNPWAPVSVVPAPPITASHFRDLETGKGTPPAGT